MYNRSTNSTFITDSISCGKDKHFDNMAKEFEDLLTLWRADAKITGAFSNPKPMRSMVQEFGKNQCFWFSIYLQVLNLGMILTTV